ncbi:Uncharacterized membrane protein, DUF4010 family [Collimonas sp. OK242]|jgi:uncharacterized membrane protein (DUF4010 family)|uniref:MgtC/SapB family protein n=1 Tax=Collimonas sp. OK242 TaxID=1798195 RepID=UPI000897569C|nr:DUF4010 domain-containing protein [Collimonas sp. OK242]SDX40817.1 Uncharacterized membrane protein, DUF4010 family [Collimonas sp. OK242]
MTLPADLVAPLAVAAGIGLLIGAERERRKGDGPTRSPAGIRTFTLVSLLGSMSMLLDSALLLVALTLAVAALLAVAYFKQSHDDPGLTTETALILTLLLGALAVREIQLAAALSVLVAIVLAARDRLHHFARSILSQREWNNALVLGAAVFVLWPLMPDRTIDPYGVLNLHTIWRFVILMLLIGALGHITQRVLGARLGLPLTGLFSGFVSSIATIGAMGVRVTQAPDQLNAAATGAVLSTVSTLLQLAIVIAATHRPTLLALALPLACGLVAALLYAALMIALSAHSQPGPALQLGSPFDMKGALLLSLIISGILLMSGAFSSWFGSNGILLASFIGGFADAHSVAVSAASLAAQGKISSHAAAAPILAGLTANSLSKCVVALTSGNRDFAKRVIPGLFLVTFMAWAGLALS